MELVNPLLFQVDLQGKEERELECVTEARQLVHGDKYSYGLLTEWVLKDILYIHV